VDGGHSDRPKILAVEESEANFKIIPITKRRKSSPTRLPMIEMAEDLLGNGHGELGDDFSLASSIDELSFDDPFNIHLHNGDIFGNYGKKNELPTPQNPTFHSKSGGMAACSSFDSPNGYANIGQITERCDLQASYLSASPRLPSLASPVMTTKISGFLLSTKEAKKTKKQTSNIIFKPENVAVKARKTTTKSLMKQSKSDGLLTMALKAKYRKSSVQHSSSGYSMNVMGESEEPALGAANASWNSGGPEGGLKHRRYSLPSGKSSSMQDLLRQSKAQCKSHFLLQQSSAHSLSKRNSFQSIKLVNEKLDVSSLLPAKQYSKSKSAPRRFSFPNAASLATKTKFATNLMRVDEVAMQQPRNDDTGDMNESLLHEACRLFPNSDTVVETALRVDPDSVRRSIVHTGDRDDNCIYGYPINLALTHGASDKILQLLVQSGPDVLTFKDGTDCGASLGIALFSKTCNLGTVELLLSANNQCAQIADRRGNYPLHIAVNYGRSLDIVMRLYSVYPMAQGMRNFHSLTPLDIAIQSSRCPEDVTDFLRSVSLRPNDTATSIINIKKEDPNQSMASLEEGLDDIMEINLMAHTRT